MKNRRALIFGAVATGAATAGLFGWRLRDPAPAPQTGSTGATAESNSFWTMRFARPEGGELEMSSLRGMPVLLNFWATWCPPCVTELPLLDAFHRRQQAAGWRVVGLAIDGPTPVREFLKTRPLGFAIGLAGLDGISVARSLGNDTGALPFTVVFGRDGSVVDRKLGALTEADLERFGRLA